MRRRVVRLGVLLAVTLAALALVLAMLGRGSALDRLSACAVGEDAFAALPAGRTEDPSIVRQLLANGFDLPRAGADFYYSMVEGDDRAFDPVLQALGTDGLRLAFPAGVRDADWLAGGGALPYIAYTDDAYAAGTLYFTALPTISVTVTEPNAEGTFDVLDREALRARFRLFDNRALASGPREIRSDTTIRIRGASSMFVPKKSYRLSLSVISPGGNLRHNPLSLLGMRYDEDWILYAAGNDPDRLRNAFSNNLWYRTGASENCLGVTLGVECRYVELVLNGEYMGLYNLMFPLDSKQVELPEDGCYYRGISYTETTPELLAQAGNETVIGGWELRSPKQSQGPETWKWLAAYLERSQGGTDGLDAFFRDTLDEQNMISLYLFLSLVQGKDNYIKNNNVIAYPQPDGSARLLLAPWDLDLTWGSSHTLENEWCCLPYSYGPDEPYDAWALMVSRLLRSSEEFRQHLCARYRELRRDAWSDETICRELEWYEAQIFASGAMVREGERWPTSQRSPDLERFRTYCLTRLHFLDDYFAEVAQS